MPSELAFSMEMKAGSGSHLCCKSHEKEAVKVIKRG
jgi:hypothetical protein